MSTHLELLRFNWKPSVIRLALAALADAGPVPRRVWVVRSGLPANHFAAALQESQRLGVLVVELPAEGLRLLVQPVAFWKERPNYSAEDFARAWSGTAEQRRMALVTEAPGLADVMALTEDTRNPEVLPDSGDADARITEVSCTSSETFRRKDVLCTERTTSKRNEHGPEFGDGLRERVRVFVGERDWRKFWEHDEWQEIFDDPVRAKVLAGSLRYLQAGLAEGVVFRKNAAAALWADYKRSLGKVLVKV